MNKLYWQFYYMFMLETQTFNIRKKTQIFNTSENNINIQYFGKKQKILQIYFTSFVFVVSLNNQEGLIKLESKKSWAYFLTLHLQTGYLLRKDSEINKKNNKDIFYTIWFHLMRKLIGTESLQRVYNLKNMDGKAFSVALKVKLHSGSCLRR